MKITKEINDDHAIVTGFFNGSIFFKITCTDEHNYTTQLGMANTISDVEQLVLSHHYTPLLDYVDVYTKLAYLYDCLERSDSDTRYINRTFWWRRAMTSEWYKWFTVTSF